MPKHKKTKAKPKAAAEINDAAHAAAPPDDERDDSEPITPDTPPDDGAPDIDGAVEGDSPDLENKALASRQAQFNAFRNARIDRAVKQLAASNILVSFDIIAERKEVAAATDETMVENAVGKAIIDLTKRATQVQVRGGSGHKDRVDLGGVGEVEGGEDEVIQARKQPADSWRCPKVLAADSDGKPTKTCGAINETRYADDDSQPYEYCLACNAKFHKHWLYANHHISKETK